MRKIIVSTYVSLDGVIENPMWTMPYWADDVAAFQSDDLFTSEALLLGRETYEGFAEAWSQRSGDAFTDRINSMPKYVVAKSLQNPTWGSTTVINGDIVKELAALKQQPGQNILKYGGGELLTLLIKHNLLDELHVLVYPVIVGSGARLVPDGGTGSLKFVETKVFSTGVVALIYRLADGAGA